MTEAIEFTRQWLIEHYASWVHVAGEEHEEDLDSYYGKEHWEKTTLKELCEELHQIIYDEQDEGIIDLAKYFTQLGEKEGKEEILTMFGRTSEHSH